MSEDNATPVRPKYLPRSPLEIENERPYVAPDWSEEHYYQYALLKDDLRFEKEEYKKLEEKYKYEQDEHKKQVIELRNTILKKMDENDNVYKQRNELKQEIENLKNKGDCEKQELIKKLHGCEDRINRQEQEIAELESQNADLGRQLRDLQEPVSFDAPAPDPAPAQDELEHYKKLLAEAEQQKDELQKQFDELKHKYDVCAANNEVYLFEKSQLEIANEENQKSCEQLRKANQEFEAAANQALKIQETALAEKKRLNKVAIQLMRENVDIRDVLREHLEEENKLLKRLHQKQLNIEEILKSTNTANKHANDPDLQ